LKKDLELTIEVCCLFYVLLHSEFFKGKLKRNYLVGFNVFLFLNPGVFFGSGFITSTLSLVDHTNSVVRLRLQLSQTRKKILGSYLTDCKLVHLDSYDNHQLFKAIKTLAVLN